MMIGGDILREALGISNPNPTPTPANNSSSSSSKNRPAPTTNTTTPTTTTTTTTTTATTTRSRSNIKANEQTSSKPQQHSLLQLSSQTQNNYKNGAGNHQQKQDNLLKKAGGGGGHKKKEDYNNQIKMINKSTNNSSTNNSSSGLMMMSSFPLYNNQQSLLGPFPLSSILFSSNNPSGGGGVRQVFGPPFPQQQLQQQLQQSGLINPFLINPPPPISMTTTTKGGTVKSPGGGPHPRNQQQVFVTSTPTTTKMTTTTPSSTTTPAAAAVPIDMIDEMVMRFMMSIPEFEKHPVRSLFQVELAHWFFVDLYCQDKNSKYAHLASVPFEKFAELMFQRTPYLKSLADSYDIYLAKFKYYKTKVPTYGAILLDEKMENVLLVQGFRGAWGFPKGKVNQAEDPLKCAIREVKEETGFDMGHLVNRKHFIESAANDRKARLYIASGVPIAFPFNPLTRFEIKNIAWFPIHELPECKKDPAITPKRGLSNSQFFAVIPFTKRLKAWIQDKKECVCEIDNFRCKGVNFDSSLFYGLMELPPDVLKAHPEWNYWNTRSDIVNYDSPLPFDSSTTNENEYQTSSPLVVNNQTRQDKNKLENVGQNNFNNGHTSNTKLTSKSPHQYQNQREKKNSTSSISTSAEKRGNSGKSNEKSFFNVTGPHINIVGEEEGLFKKKNNARRELFPEDSGKNQNTTATTTTSKSKIEIQVDKNKNSEKSVSETRQTLANLFTNSMEISTTPQSQSQSTDHFTAAGDLSLFKSPSWLNFKLDQEKINVAMNSS